MLDGYSREKVDSLKRENFKGGSLSFEGIDGATKFSGSLGEKESTGDLGAIFNSKYFSKEEGRLSKKNLFLCRRHKLRVFLSRKKGLLSSRREFLLQESRAPLTSENFS